jgi:hypothetical protein
MEVPKLLLFRRFKDPAMLRPQFHPLYLRLKFLDSIELNDSPVNKLEEQVKELVEFVLALNMGSFYAQQRDKLLQQPTRAYVRMLGGPDPECERHRRQDNREYREQLINTRDAVIGLVVELLRYQAWAHA